MTISLQRPQSSRSHSHLLERSSTRARPSSAASVLLAVAARLDEFSPPSAAEFRRFAVAAIAEPAPVVLPEEILASNVRSLGTVVFAFTPECDAPTVARHIAAALVAGNSVEWALLGETSVAVLELCAITQELLPALFWRVGTERGMRAGNRRDAIVIVTRTHVFRNDEPWIRSSHDESPECGVNLPQFYSERSTFRVSWEYTPVSFA